ncbi:MAG TPA: nitrogenase component 1 [Polyangiaceae bacterium]|jgi:hypothetical protein|nr:MAG: light-independent protochlorophyllide reductase subunit B [Deltaproteobacteria bacterium ADurb.Bin207]HNS99680.1 nitrogenase component 1 [Polyangiaceae bacterium]HNZ24287.1 nitrogenase component 1 [Polyangiaceae bacterium]HOD24253.1 nitrogenase component 1 [Polyangiaceae bacterium]HOE50844.1 nitrogenase component 1 [Polyangiaceae bacterium]
MTPGVPMPTEAIVCGAFTRERVERLLGLDIEPITYRIEKAQWTHGRLEIVVRPVDEPADDIELVLEQPSPQQQAFLRGPEVCLWARQRTLPPALARRLTRLASQRLARLRFSDLLKVIHLDPDVERASHQSEAPAPDGISTASVMTQAHTHPSLFADFFAASEFRRSRGDMLDVFSAHSLVCHGDTECAYCSVVAPRPRNALVRLPVLETIRAIGRWHQSTKGFNESPDITDITCSDMTEQDVILGAPGKLTAALIDADRKRKRDALLVIGLCVPDVIGENEDAIVQSYRKTTSTPVLTVPASPRSWGWLVQNMLETRRAPHDHDSPPEPNRINLIGFGDNPGVREIYNLLKIQGIIVNRHVLPRLAMVAIRDLHRATMNVYLPNEYWERAYSYLKQDAGRIHLQCDGPYGIAGTKRWLESIHHALGMPASEVVGCKDVLLERWEQLRAQAKQHRLGLVVPWRERNTLTDSRKTWGIPLVDFLTEMGFGIDIFVATEGSDSVDDMDFWDSPETSVTIVHSLHELLQSLERNLCEAVFSNYVFDWRLVRSGKMPFSTLEMQMGYEGSVETLRRLLAVCRTPLYRAGRRFMQGVGPNTYRHDSG